MIVNWTTSTLSEYYLVRVWNLDSANDLSEEGWISVVPNFEIALKTKFATFWKHEIFEIVLQQALIGSTASESKKENRPASQHPWVAKDLQKRVK